MKRKLTSAILVLFVAVIFASLSGCSTSGNPYGYSEPDNAYRIQKLSVEVDASAGDRSMRITERYVFEFDRFPQSHGFYRDIALNSGEKIRDLRVKNASDFYNEYDVEHDGNDILRVTVGDEDRYVKPDVPRECTIEYTMITPAHADYPDALVLNVIGQGWSCEILSAVITVKLPAATDKTPEYYYGEWGSSAKATKANGMVSEDPASGKKEYSFSVGHLDAFEGFTVYYFMPKGTLHDYSDSQVWFIVLAGIVVIGLAVLFKLTLGRDKPLAPVTNYYPPKSVNDKDGLPLDPVDLGYLIDNTCQGSDVTSLIFYFASQGYLRLIEPNSEENSSDSFKLVKVCDLPEGLPEWQYTFFTKLFSFGDEVTTSELTNKTYSAVSNVQSQVKAKYTGKLYDGKARTASVFACIAAMLFTFLAVLFTGFKVASGYINPAGALAVFPVVFSYLIGSYLVNNRLKLSKVKLWALFVLYAVVAVGASLLIIAVTSPDMFTMTERIMFAATVAAVSLIAPLIARRTEYYDRELNEVLGFKDFLQTAEKDRLETLLAENPQYYYDILPYANVLGVSDIWEDKFKNLTLEPPTYYSGNSVFTIMLFNSYYHSSFRAYSTATVSRPSSSSRSGGGRSFGGGGGFSGGGFGGGGGGRW